MSDEPKDPEDGTPRGKVIEECFTKLGEHFDGFVLVTQFNNRDDTHDTRVRFDGGYNNAVGLLVRGMAKLVADDIANVVISRLPEQE